tara:strand:- start:10 stop:543 length:534 start_codon:yes stop_codon:yes gene_type:complete
MAEFEYPFMEKVLKRYASYVIQQSKANLTKDKKGGGELYNSLKSKQGQNKQELFVDFFMANYGQFVDKGVKGVNSTYPETARALSKFQYGSGTGPKGGLTKGIDSWLKKKNFRWRDQLGRYMSYKSMRYLIVKKIYSQGLKANLFFSKPFNDGLDKFSNNLLMAFIADTENNLDIKD